MFKLPVHCNSYLVVHIKCCNESLNQIHVDIKKKGTSEQYDRDKKLQIYINLNIVQAEELTFVQLMYYIHAEIVPGVMQMCEHRGVVMEANAHHGSSSAAEFVFSALITVTIWNHFLCSKCFSHL